MAQVSKFGGIALEPVSKFGGVGLNTPISDAPQIRTPEELATAQEESTQRGVAREGDVLSRFTEAAEEPFEGFGERVRSNFEALGIERNLAEPFVVDLPKNLARAGLVVGQGALDAVGSVTNLVAQTVEEATGAPREEVAELLNVAGLILGSKPMPSRTSTPTRQISPEQRAIREQQRNLPASVPLTKADVTQDINLQSFLDEAEQGLHGQRAQSLSTAAKEAQSQGLRANVDELQRMASGRETVMGVGEAGLGIDRASQALKIAAKDSRRAISDAYDNAKSLDASIDGDLVKAFGQGTRKRLIDEGFDLVESPRLLKSLDEIEDLRLVDGNLSDATVNNLELWRKRVAKRIESVRASDPSEAQALRTLRNEYDEFSGDLLDQGLIRGNDAAISAWKNARDLRSEFGRTFEGDKIVQRLATDNLNQEEAVNLIFGGSQMGFKTQAGNVVGRIKEVLGDQSPAFKSLKEEVILRLTRNQGDEFSGNKFFTAVEKAVNNNPTLMREVFSPQELVDLRSFARFAKTVTNRKPGATNPSGTFNKIARSLQGTGVGSSFVGRFVNATFAPIIQPISEARAAQRVGSIVNFKDEVSRIRTDPELFRRAIATAVGSQVGDDNGN